MNPSSGCSQRDWSEDVPLKPDRWNMPVTMTKPHNFEASTRPLHQASRPPASSHRIKPYRQHSPNTDRNPPPLLAFPPTCSQLAPRIYPPAPVPTENQPTMSSPAPSTDDAKREQITFRFCSECSNMLYPKEDPETRQLLYTCRTCQYVEEAATTCVFRNVLNSASGETAGVTQDVASDPTVSPVPISWFCGGEGGLGLEFAMAGRGIGVWGWEGGGVTAFEDVSVHEAPFDRPLWTHTPRPSRSCLSPPCSRSRSL